MYIFIADSILRGALSPLLYSGRQHGTYTPIPPMGGGSGDLSAQIAQLADYLNKILNPYHVTLPAFPAWTEDAKSDVSRSPLCSAILVGREDEMSGFLTHYSEPVSPAYDFICHLLQCEDRWLKLNLRRQLERMSSGYEACSLIIAVLNDIYRCARNIHNATLLPPTDDPSAKSLRQIENEVFGLLCKSLSTLYLELTVLYGNLLEQAQYMDYNEVTQTACFHHKPFKPEALEYEILLAENRVMQLVNARVSDAAALSLYTKLCNKLEEWTHCTRRTPSTRMLRGIVVLENYIFALRADCLPTDAHLYLCLGDPCWCDKLKQRLAENQYIADFCNNEARGALISVECQLASFAFSFLHPFDVAAFGPSSSLWSASVPRHLHSQLQTRSRLYRENPSATFITRPYPVGGQPLIAPSAPVAASTPASAVNPTSRRDAIEQREKEVRTRLDFLANKEQTLLDDIRQLDYLKDLFCAFLKTGRINPSITEKIKIRSKCRTRFYGLFFYLHKIYLSNMPLLDYARFLVNIMESNANTDTLRKGVAKEYIPAFEKHCRKHHLFSNP